MTLVRPRRLGPRYDQTVVVPSHRRNRSCWSRATWWPCSRGAFELAQLWADQTAWPLSDRIAYDELAELAVMSALAKWLTRWQPIAIHSAVLAGARMEAIAGALGSSLQVAFDRWHEWATRHRDFIIDGKPGIREDEYEAVAGRFAAVGIGPEQA
jgi:hypothetical protein